DILAGRQAERLSAQQIALCERTRVHGAGWTSDDNIRQSPESRGDLRVDRTGRLQFGFVAALNVEKPEPFDLAVGRGLPKTSKIIRQVVLGFFRVEDRKLMTVGGGVQRVVKANHAVAEAIRGDRELDRHKRADLETVKPEIRLPIRAGREFGIAGLE